MRTTRQIIALGLLLAGGGAEAAAEGKAAKGEEVMPARPAAPSLSANVVKDAVKDSLKTAVSGALPKKLPGAPLPAKPGTAPPPTVPPPAPPAAALGAPAVGGTLVVPAVPVPAAGPPTGLASADPNERLAALRRKILRDDDFVDNDEINRDPFRSYLRLAAEKPAVQIHRVPAICEKYALEELQLIAIVSGDANPRAMFRDPTGVGYTVKRGDYLSKTAARITKILSDRVIFEISEPQPDGEMRTAEKAVLVDPQSGVSR